MHELLERQIKQAGLDQESVPAECRVLLELVDAAYRDADAERALMRRSLELTSRELMDRNAQLRQDLELKGRAEGELVQIVEALPQAVFLFASGRIVYVNAGAVRILRYDSAADLVGKPFLEIFSSEERKSVAVNLSRYERTGVPSAPTTERRLVAKDGSYVTVERGLVQTVARDGKPATIVVFTDITERRQLEARIQIADRMSSLGTMAAAVAHEINNPLAYILANAEFAAERVTEAKAGGDMEFEETLNALADTASGARRVQRIVASLKAFSHVDQDARSSVSVNGAIETAIELSFNQIRHRASLLRHLGRLPAVVANEGRLVQVFANLLVNAAQAMPEAADATITVRTFVNDDGMVVAEVIDTGSGIPPHVLPRIFDPFFTTKPRGVGTGLGLSICHGIVQSLGGSLEVESEVGRGTCIRVTLPPGENAPAVSATPAAFALEGRCRILVIDDEPAIGDSVRRLLHEHDVVFVTDAAAALSTLRSSPEFDAILCDIMMPRVGGDELFEAVRRKSPDLADRFVFMTGGIFTPRARAFVEERKRPPLFKPFTGSELRRALAAITAGSKPAT